jgi:hypothetical protein
MIESAKRFMMMQIAKRFHAFGLWYAGAGRAYDITA